MSAIEQTQCEDEDDPEIRDLAIQDSGAIRDPQLDRSAFICGDV